MRWGGKKIDDGRKRDSNITDGRNRWSAEEKRRRESSTLCEEKKLRRIVYPNLLHSSVEKSASSLLFFPTHGSEPHLPSIAHSIFSFPPLFLSICLKLSFPFFSHHTTNTIPFILESYIYLSFSLYPLSSAFFYSPSHSKFFLLNQRISFYFFTYFFFFYVF